MAESEKPKIYLITMDKSIQYWTLINQGVSDMSHLTGIGYIWDAPIKRDVQEQIQIIENSVEAGAQAIMLTAIDPILVSRAVEDAKALGIKIIYLDSPANEPAIITLATDNYGAGVSAAESMLDELNNQGIKSGSIGILGASLTMPTTTDREKGFRATFQAYPQFPILTTLYTNDNPVLAQWAARAFQNDNPDLVGLFATDEMTTTAIGNEIQNSQSSVVGIGFDLTERIRELLLLGYLKAVLVQNPYTMGYLGMAETIAAIRGYPTGPSFLNTGVTVHTKSSV